MAYGAGDVLVRAEMQATTGLPEDVVVNDWAARFVGAAPYTSGDLDMLCQVVGEFYDVGTDPEDRVGSYIGTHIDRGATHRINVYSLAGGLPLGPPIHSVDWLGPSAAVGGSNLPTEVAGVLSFHASLTGVLEESGSTRPRARRRGRVFIGPLNDQAIVDTADAPTLSPEFTQALRSNAVVMSDNLTAGDWEWCVWSRADSTLRPVVGGWTDDAPDTQRRRGTQASSRTAWVV